ncbi:hypothetical protein BN946_scf184943.g31 [Trametes cinnabarina]|uniref:DUF6532 domain-containing protein n=1 Tax=Pycnoporus cinnabarinus TaxID=5643 RepID=A0A060SCP9_PYCCI|nr:hypothetical protein BN946_scf184943.g31 [Trametes cinnabarina]
MARKRIVLSDDEDEIDAAMLSILDADASATRPSRKTKEVAKKSMLDSPGVRIFAKVTQPLPPEWESLVPGQGRKKVKVDHQHPDDKDGNRHPSAPSSKHSKVVAKPLVLLSKSASSYRAPQIDADASSDDEHSSQPPKYRKRQITKALFRNDEDSSSQDDNQDNESSADENESDEAAKTDNEDEGLEQLENNPRALEKLLADETAIFVDEETSSPGPIERTRKHSKGAKHASAAKSRSRDHSSCPPPALPSLPGDESGQEDNDDAPVHKYHDHGRESVAVARKRHAPHESSDIEVEAPPPKKKASKNKVQAAASGVARSKQMSAAHGGLKAAPKRSSTSKHREDEIPKIQMTDVGGSNTSREVHKPIKPLHAPLKAPVRKRMQLAGSDEELDIEDASDIDSDADDSGIEIVPPQSGKLALGDQHRRVRRVLKHAIYTTHVDIAIKNAFPDGPQKHGNTVHKALVNAATKFAYDDILRRLKKDEDYAALLARIRISTFRGLVRKLAEGQPCTAFGLTFGDKVKGDWLQESFRYIYPFDYENKTVKANKAYSPPIFFEILRVAFFKRANSFGFRVSSYFTSSVPDKPDEKEIPASMLALVATALYAAIDDCKNRLAQPRHFTANDYWNVYADHIQELSNLRSKGPAQYHFLMHSFWRNLCAPAGTSGATGAPRKSLLDIAGMAIE